MCALLATAADGVQEQAAQTVGMPQQLCGPAHLGTGHPTLAATLGRSNTARDSPVTLQTMLAGSSTLLKVRAHGLSLLCARSCTCLPAGLSHRASRTCAVQQQHLSLCPKQVSSLDERHLPPLPLATSPPPPCRCRLAHPPPQATPPPALQPSQAHPRAHGRNCAMEIARCYRLIMARWSPRLCRRLDERIIALPLIRPWRDIDIVCVPLPWAAVTAATLAQQQRWDACPRCAGRALHRASGAAAAGRVSDLWNR